MLLDRAGAERLTEDLRSFGDPKKINAENMLKDQRPSSNKLLLLSLFFTGFSTQAGAVILSLLLIEIGATFDVPVGVTGQLNTAASIMTILIALLMGILALRYGSRALLLVGLAFYAFAAIGCYLSTSFMLLLIAFSLNGVATAMVYPMLGTMIGEHIPAAERTKALGLITAGQPVTLVVGSPLVSYMAMQFGWRMCFLLFMLPVVLINFLLVYLAAPSRKMVVATRQTNTFSGYRGILANRSALACLLGAMIFQASMYTSLMFIISFLRQTFDVSQSMASLLIPLIGLSSAAGSLSVGRIVRALGPKKSVTYLCLVLGVFAAVIFNSSLWWLPVIIALPWAFVAGGGFVSGDTLTLDQVPEFRGTLMSLNTVARNVGIMLGTMLGGVLLVVFGYGAFGLLMGAAGIIAAAIYHKLAAEASLTP